jgi:CheY-like chemotaxis protein
MKIIVAEDDPVSRQVLSTVLQVLGHEPRVYPDGEAAWQGFDAEPARVVISDWTMPGKDGLALCRAIRTREQTDYTYFILVTADNTADSDYDFAIQADIDDFLPKPIRRDAIARRLHVAERILRFTTEIRALKQLLPICMYCHSIRDDSNYWRQMEEYIHEQTGSDFSHGVCPQCLAKARAGLSLSREPEA